MTHTAFSTHESSGLQGQFFAFFRRAVESTYSTLPFRGHKCHESCDDGANIPTGLPMFRVVVGDTKTDLFVDFESAILIQEHDGRWLERILRREIDPTMVHPTLKVTISWSMHGEMPFKDIILRGVSFVAVLALIFLHYLPFTQDTFDSCIF